MRRQRPVSACLGILSLLAVLLGQPATLLLSAPPNTAPSSPRLEARLHAPPPSSAPRPGALDIESTFVVGRDITVDLPSSAGRTSLFEPSVGGQGNALLMTGNWSAHISTNNGLSWRYVNPSAVFQTTSDHFSGGFCCDQRVAQDATRNLVFWYGQYNRNSQGTNGIKIAVFRGAGALADPLSYNLLSYTPETFGYTNTFPGSFWLDYPNLQVGSNYLYFTTNVFRHYLDLFGQPIDFLEGAIIARLPLDLLADGKTVPQPEYYDFPGDLYNYEAIAPVQGATTTMYFGVVADSTTVHVLRWRDVDQEPERAIIRGLGATYTDFTCQRTDEEADPCRYLNTRMQTGWATNLEVGFMWNSGRGGTYPYSFVYPYPFVRTLTLNRGVLDLLFTYLPAKDPSQPTLTPWPTATPYPTGTRIPTLTPYPTGTRIPTATPYPTATRIPTLTPYPTITPNPAPVVKYQHNLFHPDYAILFPSVAVNAQGDLGGALATLGGSRAPSITAFERDANTDVWTLIDVALGSYTPPDNSPPPFGWGGSRTWGDFTGVTVHEKYPNTWVGGGWVWEPDSSGFKPRPHNFWFFKSVHSPGLFQLNCPSSAMYTASPSVPITYSTEPVRSSIEVPDSPINRFAIIRAVVIVYLEHGALGDLTAALKAPGMQDAEALELFTHVGGNGTDMNILLYDEAVKPITRLQPPTYFGQFRPQVALSVLNGRFAPGTWELQLRDTNDNGVNGLLSEWELQFCRTLVQNPATVGVFRPNAGVFYLRNQNTSGVADLTVPYGAANDFAVTGDWNDDGLDTIGVYRDQVYYLRNANTAGPADLYARYGLLADLPMSGDWDGYSNTYASAAYSKATLGVFRAGGWFLRNRNDSGVSDIDLSFGLSGDQPVVGDWTGQGYDSIGVFRRGAWYLRNSNTSGPADLAFLYGRPGDIPVVGDWDGDGVETAGVYRDGVFYLRNTNTSGYADLMFAYGMAGDIPLAGDWNGLP